MFLFRPDLTGVWYGLRPVVVVPITDSVPVTNLRVFSLVEGV